jgi:hypothetical protein
VTVREKVRERERERVRERERHSFNRFPLLNANRISKMSADTLLSRGH